MYKPSFKTKKSGLPVISKEEIDCMAERYIFEFCPKALATPQEIDIDSFASNYLNVNQDFQYLSHNGIYLGMMVFNDTKKVIVYNPDKNEAEYLDVKARTIIIDNNLLENNQEHRYRYTMGHECGHDILHRGYFVKGLSNQISLFESQDKPLIQCRAAIKADKNKRLWTDKDWMEWQSNYMSSALLMPKSMVKNLIESIDVKNNVTKNSIYVYTVADVFNVSIEAAKYRLSGLGSIPEDAIIDDVFLFDIS